MNAAVLRLADVDPADLRAVLGQYGLALEPLPAGVLIPGSYWRDEEAGLIGDVLYLRPDTPLHSALHEASHWLCLDAVRRTGLHTDAGSDDIEECAVCYLQILLADRVPGLGRQRMWQDMDAWGYSFRLGSARAWFEQDAEDARAWLASRGLLALVGPGC